MSSSESRLQDSEDTRPEAKRGGWRGWWLWILIVLIVASIFVAPMIIRYVKAPPISEGFGLEDAVVAMRVEARDASYLVLVNEAGDTRSVRLDERGFENSRIAWSENGLSTGGPEDEYLIREDGLVEMPLTVTNDSLSERTRLATDDGFFVSTGSAEGNQLGFVDASAGELTAVDAGSGSAEFAVCDGEVVTVTEAGVEPVSAENADIDGLGMFDDVSTLVCGPDELYGLGEINDGDPALQRLRVWDRETGEMSERTIRYPGDVSAWRASTPFVRGDRLYWAADWRVWSVPLPDTMSGVSPSAPIDAEEEVYLGYDGDGFDIVVGAGEGILAHAGDRVFTVAADEKLVSPRRGPSYDRLLGMTIVAADVTTGERRAAIELDDIDFPDRDVSVHAIAVDPEWAAGR